MAKNYIDYDKLYIAQKKLKEQIDELTDLIKDIKNIEDSIQQLQVTHESFQTNINWAQDIKERLREYRGLYRTLVKWCIDAITIFEGTENDISINADKLKDFNESETAKDWNIILTGKNGGLNLQLDKETNLLKESSADTKDIKWTSSKVKNKMYGKTWDKISKTELKSLTGATVVDGAKSTQSADNKGKGQKATNYASSGGNQSYSGGSSGGGSATLTTMGTAGLGIGGAAAGIGSAISGGTTSVGEAAASSKTEEKDKKESVEETKTDETKTTETNETTTDQKTGDTETNTTQVEETKTEETTETKDTALDNILKGAESTKTELKTAVDNAKTEVKDALKTSENNLNDKMEEVKKAVEESAQKEVTTETVAQEAREKVEATAQPAKQTVQATAPKVEQPKVEAPKTEPTEPTTETPAPTDSVEPDPVDSSIVDEPVVDDPEPVHTKIPEDDSTSTVTKVPSEEPKSSSSSSSGGGSKVVPVIAGVAAAGAAGVGTKIYLDNKSAPENTYINEEFVVDDSDYSASTSNSAEVGTDTDLLHEETSSYTTRANSETTDSKDDMLDSGIGDDLTYGMKMTDDNVSFDESTPYEAIDNYEMGETH